MSENKKDGFIPIYRSLFKHWVWETNEPFDKRSAWIDLIQLVKYDEGLANKMVDGKLIPYNRGEAITSIRYLKNRWKWQSTTKVENFLENLKKDNMIKTEKRQGITVISICNYATYNDFEKTENTAYYQEQIRWQYEQNILEGQRKDEIKQVNNITSKQVEQITIPAHAGTTTDDDFIKNKEIGKEYIQVLMFISQTKQIKKLEKVLEAKQYEKVREEYSKEQILEMLEKMENSKSTKSKTSVYLTLLNYLKLNFGNKEINEHYDKFEDLYREFIVKNSNGTIISPKIERHEKSDLRNIIEFLKENSTEKSYNGAFKSFAYIMANWNMLDSFMQKRIKLNEINNDIQKIITCIKNAKSKSNNSKGNNTTGNYSERREFD